MALRNKDPLSGLEKLSLVGAPDSTIGDSGAESSHARILQIELSERVVQQMRDSVEVQKNVQLSFGKSPTLRFGNTTRQVKVSPLIFRQEVYRTDSIDAQRLHFAGLISHSATLEKVKEATAGTDAAVAELKAKLEGYAKERESNRATVVDNNVKSKSRRLILDEPASRTRQRASDTSLAAASASRANTVTSDPSVSSANSKDQAKKYVLAHLLAVGPISESEVVKRTRIDSSECVKLLDKLGTKREGEWKLSDRHFKELDVYNFPYISAESRKSAIDNAVKSFDRMRISTEDEMWQKLLPFDERGKGKTLSKLNINIGATPPITLSNTHRTLLRHLGTSHQRSKSKESNRAAGSDREDVGKATRPAGSAKATKKSPDSSAESSKLTKAAAEKRKAAANPKIKSAEFVYDSDEELDSDEDLGRKDVKRLKDNEGVARKASSPASAPPSKVATASTRSKLQSKSTNAGKAASTELSTKPAAKATALKKPPAPVTSSETTGVKSKPPAAAKDKKPEPLHRRHVSADTTSRVKLAEPSPLSQTHSAANTPQLQANGSDVDTAAGVRQGHSRLANHSTSQAIRFSLSPKTSRSRGTSLSSAANSANPDENGYKSSSPDGISPQQLIARRDAAWCSYYEERISSENGTSKSNDSRAKLWELWRDANFWAKEVREVKPGAPELTEHSVPVGSLKFFMAKLKKHRQDRKTLAEAIKAKGSPTSDQRNQLSNLDGKIASFVQLCKVAKDAELASRNHKLLLATGTDSSDSGWSRRQTMNEYARFCTLYGKYRSKSDKIRGNPEYPDVSQAELDEEHKMYARLCELRRDVLNGVFKLIRKFNEDPTGAVTRKGAKDSVTDPPGSVLDKNEANALRWKTRALHHEWSTRLVQALEHFGDVDPEDLIKLWDEADVLKRDANKVAKAFALDFGKKDSARLEDLRYEEVWGTKGLEIPGEGLESRINGRV